MKRSDYVCVLGLRQYIILFLLILLGNIELSAQSDSIFYWHNSLQKASTQKATSQIGDQVVDYLKRKSEKTFLLDAEIALSAAANCYFTKDLFYQLFYEIEGIAKEKNKETEFAVLAIKLENEPEFSDQIVQHQLYYYYTLLYHRLKEYYYAEKYCSLYLKSGINSFPENTKVSYQLNAMTILALIDQAKNNLTGAYQKLNATLDSSLQNKNNAWVGITKGNMAYVLYQQGKLLESIDLFYADIHLSLQNNELGSAMNSYIILKDVYEKLNKPERSNSCLDSAHLLLNTLIQTNQSNLLTHLQEAIDINNAIAERFYKNNDYQNSSQFYSKAFELQNLQSKEVKELQLKKVIEGIEIDRNSNQINELKQEINQKKQTQFYFLAILISVVGILLTFIYFYRSLRKVTKSMVVKSEIIKQQNLALEKTNNDKDRLFSIISHDLRGPTNTLHSLFKAVADKKLPISTLEDQLPTIVKNSTNLINTLESLLTWSMSQLKGIVPVKEAIDINESVIKNISFFEDMASSKSIQLINNCHSKTVLIDKNHIEIILRNFTSNAIKFSKPNSSIEFNQSENADYVEISITDQGAGISDEQIRNIMNSIAMKSVVGTAGEKGIGLGLLLTKEFIEINGGSLKIKSVVNEGTTMSFTIPKHA